MVVLNLPLQSIFKTENNQARCVDFNLRVRAGVHPKTGNQCRLRSCDWPAYRYSPSSRSTPTCPICVVVSLAVVNGAIVAEGKGGDSSGREEVNKLAYGQLI